MRPPAARSDSITGSTQSESRVCFNGTALNIDYASYISQHDVVYQTPCLDPVDSMPVGDGDLTAMVSTPHCIRLQVQKSDLWSDPLFGEEENLQAWRLVSAGVISLFSAATLRSTQNKFEQRLSVGSGSVQIETAGPEGECHATIFASATAGVIVVRYHDRTVRNSQRRIELAQFRTGHLFARGPMIGLIEAFADRRFALIARVADRPAESRLVEPGGARIDVEPYSSGGFTLYVAVATSSNDGDPVSAAKSRIDQAMARGYNALLGEHRRHWAQFWHKSFLSLSGPEDDPIPGFLENLWYLNIYYLACGSRGYDPPLPAGGSLLAGGDARRSPALYDGEALRKMLRPFFAANHLELTVPFASLYRRLLADGGVQPGAMQTDALMYVPHKLNRFGAGFDDNTYASRPARMSPSPLYAGLDAMSITNAPAGDPGDGLDVALFVWEMWRHAPDYMLLRDMVYPIMRRCAEYPLACVALYGLLVGSEALVRMRRVLRALIWCAGELAEHPTIIQPWRTALESLPEEPEGDEPADSIAVSPDPLRFAAQGLRTSQAGIPDLAECGDFCHRLQSMMLAETRDWEPDWEPDEAPSGVVGLFEGLPDTWSAAVSLLAPGGFRVSAETTPGRVKYVAVHSQFGGPFRIANPFGSGAISRVRSGHTTLHETCDPVLLIQTERDHTYTIEHTDLPLFRTVPTQRTGHRSQAPRLLNDRMLGKAA